jgi:hypothetical protein
MGIIPIFFRLLFKNIWYKLVGYQQIEMISRFAKAKLALKISKIF